MPESKLEARAPVRDPLSDEENQPDTNDLPEAVQEIAELDKLVHEPARLAILTALANCREADFLFLQNVTGLTKGNLSAHLSKLETGELVAIHKQFVGRKPRTSASLTEEGRRAIQDYWRQMKALQAALAPMEEPTDEPELQLDSDSGLAGDKPSGDKPAGDKPAKKARKDSWRAW